jgi:anti-sigma B factor antagonist
MKTKVDKHGDIAVVTPKGSLVGGDETVDLQTTIRALIDEGNLKLVVDLGKVDFLTSRPIGVLTELHVNYKKREGHLILCNVDKRLKMVLVITQLVKVFDITEDLEGALKKLGGA